MSDILKTAEMYRGKLQAKITKIDEFLSFARELSKMGAPETTQIPADVADKTATAEEEPLELPRAKRDAAAPVRRNSEPAPKPNGRVPLFRGAAATPDGKMIVAEG